MFSSNEVNNAQWGFGSTRINSQNNLNDLRFANGLYYRWCVVQKIAKSGQLIWFKYLALVCQCHSKLKLRFLRIPLKFLAIDTNTPGESEVLWKDITNPYGNNKQKDYHIMPVKIICKRESKQPDRCFCSRWTQNLSDPHTHTHTDGKLLLYILMHPKKFTTKTRYLQVAGSPVTIIGFL